MTDLMTFTSPDFGDIRTVTVNNEPWFVGRDVAAVLGYRDTVNALKAHVYDEDKTGWQITTPSRGNQEMTIINESGLYSLILSSKLPSAKKFKHWVTTEVLPSIRRHGTYMTPETLQAAITNPDYLLQIVTALKDETDKRKALEAANSRLIVDNQIMQPKADYFDELVERNTLLSFRETAKELGVPPKKFISFLLEKKYIYRDRKGKLLPYEAKNKGLFEVKECLNDTSGWSGVQTLVTPKGRETFRLLYVI